MIFNEFDFSKVTPELINELKKLNGVGCVGYSLNQSAIYNTPVVTPEITIYKINTPLSNLLKQIEIMVPVAPVPVVVPVAPVPVVVPVAPVPVVVAVPPVVVPVPPPVVPVVAAPPVVVRPLPPPPVVVPVPPPVVPVVVAPPPVVPFRPPRPIPAVIPKRTLIIPKLPEMFIQQPTIKQSPVVHDDSDEIVYMEVDPIARKLLSYINHPDLANIYIIISNRISLITRDNSYKTENAEVAKDNIVRFIKLKGMNLSITDFIKNYADFRKKYKIDLIELSELDNIHKALYTYISV